MLVAFQARQDEINDERQQIIYQKNAEISKYFMQVQTQKSEHESAIERLAQEKDDAIQALRTTVDQEAADKLAQVTFAKNNEISKLFNDNRNLTQQVADGERRLLESEDLLANVQQ